MAIVVDSTTPAKISVEGRDWRYLLELSLVQNVAGQWSHVRAGELPTLDELVQAVIWYVEYDCYLPLDARARRSPVQLLLSQYSVFSGSTSGQ